ncbi:M20/M25/M40 family metallo-hydrolase [Streptomyces massasporeus]
MSAPARQSLVIADVVETTRRLIRHDTTNPPGETAACTMWLRDQLSDAGLHTRVVSGDRDRPNLVARLEGRGEAPPLVLHAHTDVVPTAGQPWSRPAFSGDLVPDGRGGQEIWGRGAVDMKGPLAMMTAALHRLSSGQEPPAGDIVLAVVSDEEVGSTAGASYLLREHPELFDGARYAIGEEGGAGLDLDGALRVHPVVMAEKRACWLRVTLRGPAGHGSRVAGPDTAVRRLTRLLSALEPGGLPPVVTPVVERLLTALHSRLSGPVAAACARLREDPEDPAALNALPARDAQYFRSVVRHSVNPTVLRGGVTTNVLPAEITVELDGRLLPGPYPPERFVKDLSELVGFPLDVEVLVLGEEMPEPAFDGFYETLAGILAEKDPGGVPVPMMTTASTDARLFARLGITCFGWTPLLLPAGAPHRWLLHTPDERVPVDALRFGADCFETLLRRYR